MDRALVLTGLVDDNAMYLYLLREDRPIDLKAIIFAAILIGAIGAVMDVAMDLSSSLQELSIHSAHPTFASLSRSGFTIGRDIMGTMANTLVLAYLGGSLAVVLLFAAYAPTLTHLFNREMIAVEILQALAGSLGILASIPITSLVGGWLMRRREASDPSPNL